MLTYQYQCPTCSLDFTVRKSITQPPPTACPECGNDGLRTVFHAVTVIDTTPRTVGAQADRNHAKAGRYEREARHREIDEARDIAGRAGMDPRMLPPGWESARKPDPQAWWRPGTKQADPRLVRADSAAKRRYLEDGRI